MYITVKNTKNGTLHFKTVPLNPWLVGNFVGGTVLCC